MLKQDSLAPSESIAKDVPYENIVDFAAILTSSCTLGDHFQWSSSPINFMKALSVALHHHPPGHMVILHNRQSPPEWFASGSRKIEVGIVPLGDYVPDTPSSSKEGIAKQGGSRKTKTLLKKEVGG